jgi:tripartite-type tricarboxylate transporter receptor subunit TctC
MFESYLRSAGLKMSKVPYRNAVDAANDLAEGRIQVYRSAYAIVRPRLESGKIKVLAMSNSVRAPAAPDIPTVAEAGYPALTIDGLVGLFGPPSMPMALREQIAADVKAVVDADPVIAERLTLTGQFVNPGGPAEFGRSIDEQRATLAAAAKTLGVMAKQ